MFTTDTAQKPHLIVKTWKYLNPDDKKWHKEEKIKVEPHIVTDVEQVQSKKDSSMATQIEAMESVIQAMELENMNLKAEIRKPLFPEMQKEIDELRETQRTLKTRSEDLKKKVAMLEEKKKKYTALLDDKEKVELKSRDILANIMSQEADLKEIKKMEEKKAEESKTAKLSSQRNSLLPEGELVVAEETNGPESDEESI